MRNNLFFIWLFLCFASCDSNVVLDEYRTISDQWQKNEVVEFKVTPPDTLKPYSLFVNVRNTNDYKFNNLYLIVEMNYPHGKIDKDTLEYRMTTPEGKFLGTGFTDVKENKLWYKGYEKPFIFSETGDYILKIQHAMRANGSIVGLENLDGIIDVGFRIEKPQIIN